MRRSVAAAGIGVLFLLLGLTLAYAETAPAPEVVFGALLLVLAIAFFIILSAGVPESDVPKPSNLQEIFMSIYSIPQYLPIKINMDDGIPTVSITPSITPSLFSVPSSIPAVDVSWSWSWDRD